MDSGTQIIQAGVSPIIVISACGLLSLAFYNRLTAVVARLRSFHREQLQVNEAIEHCRRALELQPTLATAEYNWANALLQKKDWHGAMEHYRAALKLQPIYPMAENNLANLLSQANRVDEAMEHYRSAIASAPKVALMHNNLGNALVRQGHVDEAIVAFRAQACLGNGKS